MFALLGMLLVGATASVSALGGAHCTWGPTYWCANIPQASECSAVKHCIKAVWEKQKVADDDDDVCKICKEMVTEARDQLLSNETQTELREVFDGSCDLIPVSIIATECKKLADEFVVELVETLASEMNPVTVCTVAGLCNSARIDKLLAAASPKASNVTIGGDCPICREGAKEVKQQLKITDKHQMEDKFLEICGYAGSFSEACRAGVLEEFENIYTWLTQSFDDSVCDVTGVCSPVYLNVPPTQLQQGGDIQCEFCEKVIQHWVDVYASNSSLEEFKMILDSICDRVDKKNAAHCKHIVDDYYIPAFEFIKNEINPHTVCSLVGLCGNGGFMKVSPKTAITTLLVRPKEKVEMMPLQPAIKMTGQEQFQANWMHSPSGPASLNGALYVPSAVAIAEKPTCVLCEFVLNRLQTYLEDGQTEAQIKAAVQGVCNVMPEVLRDECSKFVDKYEPAIVELLVREVDPSQLCPLMKLCDKQGALQSALMPQGLASLKKDSNCEMCQFALTEVFSVLKDKDNQDMVKNVLESICYRLPNSIEMECEDFVEKYTNTAIDMIVNGLTPDEICKAMDMCSRHSTPPPPPKPKDTGCVICEYVITTLDGMIEDKTNEKEIKDALESLCSYLPSTVSKQCNSFVETYTDMIIEMLTHDISPEQICTELGLCDSVGNVVQHIQHKIVLDPLSASPYCTLCEYAIQELDNMLEDKSNEEEIKQSLDILCNQLSLPVKKQCIKMVSEYTDQIIDLFIKEYTPEMVCTELSLCVNNDINSNDIPAINGPVQIIDIPRITPQPKPTQVGKSVGGVSCVMCEFAMKILDEHLEDPSSIDQVERMVQFLCSYLPGTVADTCEDLVDEYGERIVKAIVEDEMEPEQICTEVMGVCSSSLAITSTTAAPGGKKCAWGPAYWCKTPFHAEICGATQHCQDKVWTNGGL